MNLTFIDILDICVDPNDTFCACVDESRFYRHIVISWPKR